MCASAHGSRAAKATKGSSRPQGQPLQSYKCLTTCFTALKHRARSLFLHDFHPDAEASVTATLSFDSAGAIDWQEERAADECSLPELLRVCKVRSKSAEAAIEHERVQFHDNVYILAAEPASSDARVPANAYAILIELP